MKKSPKISYLRRIRNEFPDLKWNQAVYNHEGWDHAVIILDNKIIFRFPDSNEKKYISLFSKELQLTNYLKDKISLDIPYYEFKAKDKSFGGYKMIQGKPLTPWIFQNKIKKPTRAKIAKQLGTFITQLHGVPLSIAKKGGAEVFNDERRHVLLKKVVKKKVFPKISNLDKGNIEKIIKMLSSLRYKNRVLVHSDLISANIIVKNDYSRIAGIIDFSDRIITDSAKDFSGLWLYGRKFVEQTFSYYKLSKEKEIIDRSWLYSLRKFLWTMVESQKSDRCDLSQELRKFRKVLKMG